MVSLFDQWTFRQSVLLEPGEKSIVPRLHRLQVHWTGDERDAPVAERNEVIQRFVNPLRIIDPNVRAMSAAGAGIHENGGDISSRQLGDQARVGFGSHDGHAVYLAFHHAPYAAGHALRVVI